MVGGQAASEGAAFAARRGHVADLKVLLHADRAEIDGALVRAAASNGHAAAVEWLATRGCRRVALGNRSTTRQLLRER